MGENEVYFLDCEFTIEKELETDMLLSFEYFLKVTYSYFDQKEKKTYENNDRSPGFQIRIYPPLEILLTKLLEYLINQELEYVPLPFDFALQEIAQRIKLTLNVKILQNILKILQDKGIIKYQIDNMQNTFMITKIKPGKYKLIYENLSQNTVENEVINEQLPRLKPASITITIKGKPQIEGQKVISIEELTECIRKVVQDEGQKTRHVILKEGRESRQVVIKEYEEIKAEIVTKLEEIREILLDQIIKKLDTQFDLLKEKLPKSDFEKIKEVWEDYKNGKITKWDMVKKAGIGIFKKIAHYFQIDIE
ncbi:MAG: hypothetical protein ACTSYB_12035 [Candidatus Helarchaeota archaeon]